MSFREKSAWITALVTAAAYAVYLGTILKRADGALPTVPYADTLLWTLGAVILFAILAHIVVAIASPNEAGQTDERDREIYRRGEYIGQWVVVLGALGALGLALAEFSHFWIANLIYLAFVLSTLVASTAKILAYRRGMPRW